MKPSVTFNVCKNRDSYLLLGIDRNDSDTRHCRDLNGISIRKGKKIAVTERNKYSNFQKLEHHKF